MMNQEASILANGPITAGAPAVGLMVFDEAGLVATAKSGNSEAFGELYQRYHRRLYATAFRILHNREDAEDAVQQSFQHALANLSRFREDARFPTWLTRIVINEALLLIRYRRKFREPSDAAEGQGVEEVLAERADGAPTPEKWCADQEVQVAVRNAISSLRSRLRRAVVLRDLDGCSIAETARKLSISVPALKARIHRARRHMRRHIERRHTAGHTAFLQ